MLKKSTHLLKDAAGAALKPLNQSELKLAMTDLAEIGREQPAVAAMLKAGGPLCDFIAAAFTLSPYLRDAANIDNESAATIAQRPGRTGRSFELIGLRGPGIPDALIDTHLPMPVAHCEIAKTRRFRASWCDVIRGFTLRAKALD